MFEIVKNSDKEPKTKPKSFRLPLYIIKALNNLKDETGVSVNQILIQMIEYCLTN